MSNFEEKVLKALGKMQGSIEGLQGSQEQIRSNIEELQATVTRVEVKQEHMEDKIDQIIETVAPEFQKTVENTGVLNDHEQRITLLESAQKIAA